MEIIYENASMNYRLKGNANSRENILLTEWHDLIFPLEDRAINFMGKNSTYVDYFPLQEEITAKAKVFMEGKSSGNATFDRLMVETVKWDLAMFAANFLNTPRSAHPAIEEYSPFYATLKPEEYTQNTASVYAQPYGMRTLDALVRVEQRKVGVKAYTGVEGVTEYFKYVKNDTLKGNVLLNFMSSVKTSADFDTYHQAFAQYLVTEEQQERSNNILYPLLEYKPGTDGYAFSYPDNKGNVVTLASLKGKVVLVDVWATWCGPCRAQFPHLKQLEEEMEGKDVAIVSLSTDAEKDREKWRQMIVDEGLGGIQLFAGQGNEFSKYYKINAIPRFLVFDKQGKIVTVDSPRPSDPALKELLLKELSK
jgi:thiol-disulfide isomerase/thioredoxin